MKRSGAATARRKRCSSFKAARAACLKDGAQNGLKLPGVDSFAEVQLSADDILVVNRL